MNNTEKRVREVLLKHLPIEEERVERIEFFVKVVYSPPLPSELQSEANRVQQVIGSALLGMPIEITIQEGEPR